MALGFFSASQGAFGNGIDSSANFYGLLVTPTGKIELVTDGTVNTTNVATISGFSASTFYNLSYEVNTSTGALTDVAINGTDITGLPSVGGFTAATTTYAGFAGNTSTSVNDFGRVDNFEVESGDSAVPEPSSWALILGGAGMLVFIRNCFRRS